MRWWEGCNTVHCGFWVNWSDGAVNGSTLTLPTQWGLIVTAFFALFIKLVGGYLWGIICFALHQQSASSRPEDDIYHQHQVILRNTEHETSFIWNLHKVAFAHKGTRSEAYRRSFWLILLAVIHGVSFSIVGGLSSSFIVLNNEVQLLPGQCGWVKEVPLTNLTDDATFAAANALIVSVRNGFRRSATYSRSCYAQAEGSNTACGTYIQAALPYDSNFEAPCPFDVACNGSAVVMDTGLLRSDKDFGINTQAKDAMSLRKQVTCAPLAGEKYTDGWLTSNDSLLIPPGEALIGYKFGDLPQLTAAQLSQYTFRISGTRLQSGDSPYQVASQSFFQNYTGDQASHFDPIPEIRPSDADLSLIALTNRMTYRNPMMDKWFDAQGPLTITDGNLNGTVTYQASNALSFLGCQERYQFCTSDTKTCTPFTGFYALEEELEGLSPTQNALYRVLWKMVWSAQLNLQIGLIGRENLVANDYLWDNGFSLRVSTDLPPDHWHHEVANWMNTSLAVMQRAAASYVRPEEFDAGAGVSFVKHISPPEDPAMQLLCHKAKMRSTEFTSFSVLGLFLTLALGMLILAANAFMPTIAAWWQRRTGLGAYKRLEWVESNAFQLQRMAAEGRGIGPWEGKEADVPRLAERGYMFNLTGESLRGGGGTGEVRVKHGYQGLVGHESPHPPEGFELVDFDDKGESRGRYNRV
ncbi:hypothetical protein K458DRAFT_111142 [Lentithecium fluviatile CBS 122367]|uniref:Uncharacterized protein n=1 Tax=Lentithecium fluviatile CBS 122367 TaxID=1168545 RepID=A0A6G1IQD7_9PLEO|nr:hypothetical protein K458DRAFT_111142 [Lentithecium fluviatile CBS 122367]